MKVEVTVCGKPLGALPVGAKLFLSAAQAKVLVAIKRVTYTKDEVTVEVPAEPRRRTYRTREMKAD